MQYNYDQCTWNDSKTTFGVKTNVSTFILFATEVYFPATLIFLSNKDNKCVC